MTVEEALALAAGRLRAAGILDAALDAELLLRHTLGWSRADVIARGREGLGPGTERSYLDLVRERASRRPLQHLTGRQAFWRREFEVTPDVLVPRPETELLVEAALELLPPGRTDRVVDVGTGTGCIALSLAGERPGARVVATDLSAAALRVARRNRERLGLAGRVALVQADLLAGLRDRSADLVAGNPPYVEDGEWETLEPEVRLHEPRMALVPPGGAPALYGRIVEQAARVLRPGGHLLLEAGRGQADLVAAAGRARGFTHVRTIPDLQAIPRAVVMRLGP